MIRQIYFRTVTISRRFYSQQSVSAASKPPSTATGLVRQRPKRKFDHSDDLITMDTAKAWRDMSPREKTVYATKQTSYTGLILAGMGLSATLLYMVFGELFGGMLGQSNSASGVYGRTLDLVKDNETACKLLGEPVRGYKELQRHRFKQHKMNVYTDDKTGDKMAFMRFNVAGEQLDGRVNVWLRESKDGREWQTEHVNLEVPAGGRPQVRVVIQENRAQPTPLPELQQELYEEPQRPSAV